MKYDKNSAVFTTTFNALGKAMHSTWSNFGIPNPKKFLEDFLAIKIF